MAAFSRSSTPFKSRMWGEPTCAALHLDDDFLIRAAGVVLEIDDPVHALVRPLLLVLGRGRRPPAPRPTTRTGGGCPRPGPRRRGVRGLADDLIGGQLRAEGVVQALLDQGDGQMRDVNADPAPFQPLGHGDGGAAAAEGVQDHIAFVAGGIDNALQQRLGLLGGVAEAFSARAANVNICPKIV